MIFANSIEDLANELAASLEKEFNPSTGLVSLAASPNTPADWKSEFTKLRVAGEEFIASSNS